LERTRAAKLPSLEENVIPLEPAIMKHSITIERGKEKFHRWVIQCQYPITLGYAFTDYRAQGQTIPKVIMDIMAPPGNQQLTLFNIYVALS
jgi:hypothetical protein